MCRNADLFFIISCNKMLPFTCSERVPINNPWQKPTQSAYWKPANESTKLLTDLLSLKTTHWCWCYTNICMKDKTVMGNIKSQINYHYKFTCVSVKTWMYVLHAFQNRLTGSFFFSTCSTSNCVFHFKVNHALQVRNQVKNQVYLFNYVNLMRNERF